MRELTKQISFRMPASLRETIEAIGKQNERTLSQQIIFELRQNHPTTTVVAEK